MRGTPQKLQRGRGAGDGGVAGPVVPRQVPPLERPPALLVEPKPPPVDLEADELPCPLLRPDENPARLPPDELDLLAAERVEDDLLPDDPLLKLPVVRPMLASFVRLYINIVPKNGTVMRLGCDERGPLCNDERGGAPIKEGRAAIAARPSSKRSCVMPSRSGYLMPERS